MDSLFLFSAIFGGTFLLCQFVATLVGLDGDGDEMSLSFDPDADSPGFDHSTWLFGVISLRTLTAGATFFGLTGLISSRMNAPQSQQLAVAVVCGLAAVFGVHALMSYFRKLNQAGNLKISNAIGSQGTVTVAIPAEGKIPGRVQFQIQGRIEEFPALSEDSSKIETGSQVEIVATDGSVHMIVKIHTAQSPIP